MTAVRCRNSKCGAEDVETRSARYDDDARKLGNPSILGIVLGAVVLFCLLGIVVAFIGAVLQSQQGRPVDNHTAVALVGLWLGSVIWRARSGIRARRRFSEAPTTFVHNCARCGHRWTESEGGVRRVQSKAAGGFARAGRTLEAAEQRRWRDSAAWGDYYPRQGDR